jgi:hypothetical protein
MKVLFRKWPLCSICGGAYIKARCTYCGVRREA